VGNLWADHPAPLDWLLRFRNDVVFGELVVSNYAERANDIVRAVQLLRQDGIAVGFPMQTANAEIIFPVGKDFTLTQTRYSNFSTAANCTLKACAGQSRRRHRYAHAQASCIFLTVRIQKTDESAGLGMIHDLKNYVPSMPSMTRSRRAVARQPLG